MTLGLKVEIIAYTNFNLIEASHYDLVVLGPGPGHINDYINFHEHVRSLINLSNQKKIKLLGVCLGHQLIHHCLNRKILKLKKPIHGQSIKLQVKNHSILIEELSNKDVFVQLYNSWGVFENGISKTFSFEIKGDTGEILASFSKFITTYQFHPESIGTSCPELFFKQSLV